MGKSELARPRFQVVLGTQGLLGESAEATSHNSATPLDYLSRPLNLWGFLGGSAVKNLPATQKAQIPSLGREDPLEEEMASYSSILAWEIPWTEEPGRLQSMGSQRVGHD